MENNIYRERIICHAIYCIAGIDDVIWLGVEESF
jgi:hypothetical protein